MAKKEDKIAAGIKLLLFSFLNIHCNLRFVGFYKKKSPNLHFLERHKTFGNELGCR